MYGYELSALLVSSAMLLVVCGLIARNQRERFRFQIRSLRDELFDFMWQRGYSYDLPAYQEARQVLNGMIRLSNVMTPMRFLVLLVREPARHRRMHVERLQDEELRKKIVSIYTRAVCEWIRFLFLTGSVGVCFRGLFLWMDTLKAANRFKTFLKRKKDELESGSLSAAYEFGSPRLSI